MRFFILLLLMTFVAPAKASSEKANSEDQNTYFRVANIYVDTGLYGVGTDFPLSADDVKAITCDELLAILKSSRIVLWGCSQEPPLSRYPGGSDDDPNSVSADLLVMRVGVTPSIGGYIKQDFRTPIYTIAVSTNRLLPFRGYKGNNAQRDVFEVVPFAGNAALFKEDFTTAIKRTVGAIARRVAAQELSEKK